MFNDTFLHLLQAVVVAVEHLLSMREVEVVFAVFVPRQTDDGLHILHLHGVVRRLLIEPLQLAHLLLEHFSHVCRPFLLLRLLTKIFYLYVVDITSQLFLDGLYLLLEEILALLLVQVLVGLHLYGSLQLHQLTLAVKYERQTESPLAEVADAEKSLLLRRAAREIAAREVHEVEGILVVLYEEYQVTRRLAHRAEQAYRLILDGGKQSLELVVRLVGDGVFQQPYLTRQIGLGIFNRLEAETLLPLQDDGGRPVRHLEHADNIRNHARRVQVFVARVFRCHVLLADDTYQSLPAYSLL